jgi:hypothetical protein
MLTYADVEEEDSRCSVRLSGAGAVVFEFVGGYVC